MLIKYLYSYNKSKHPCARLAEYKTLDPRVGYGIVFGKIVEKSTGRDDTYDIPLASIVEYLQGGELPTFPTSIPRADSDLVVDLVSESWKTFTCTLDEDALDYTYSKNPGNLTVSGFAEFFNNGLWYQANDLNLDYDTKPTNRSIMERYVREYGRIYLEYIAANRKYFPDIPGEWLEPKVF